VIKTFKDDHTQKIYQRQLSQKFPAEIQRVALRKLRMINNATSVDDLHGIPANHLAKLDGDRDVQWSVSINSQWHICFEWQGSHAYNVELVDYH
jgi:proteic killer suppression protein